MKKKIALKGQDICYELHYKKVKNINLRIRPDKSISVSANKFVSEKVITGFLLSKADFILGALKKYDELAIHAPKPKQYISGESYHLLGQDFLLQVIEGSKNAACSDEKYITLTVKNIEDFELRKRTFDKWFKSLCVEIVTSLCKEVYPSFQNLGVSYPQIRFRKMTSRWGSCHPIKQILTFNLSLIEMPLTCIEYVVVHEFTHFLQPNHSKAFYDKLSTFMPDWKERKAILKINNAS